MRERMSSRNYRARGVVLHAGHSELRIVGNCNIVALGPNPAIHGYSSNLDYFFAQFR